MLNIYHSFTTGLSVLSALITFCLFATACSVSESANTPETVESPKRMQEKDSHITNTYGLSINSGADLAVTIKLNGVPSSAVKAGKTLLISLPVEQDVLPGRNVIEVVVGTAEVSPSAPLKSASLPLPQNRDLEISLELDKTTEPETGMFETEVEVLKVATWEPEIENNEVKLPDMFRLEFSAPKDRSSPIWSKAERSSVADMKTDFTAVYKDIIRALQSGDVEKIGRLSEKAYQESARAFPLDENAKEAEESDVVEMKDIISAPGAEIPDLLEPLQCKSYAQGRLFECFAKDGEPPVRILTPNEDPIYFKFLFSVIDGKLSIVR